MTRIREEEDWIEVVFTVNIFFCCASHCMQVKCALLLVRYIYRSIWHTCAFYHNRQHKQSRSRTDCSLCWMPPHGSGSSTRMRRQTTTPLLWDLHWLCISERIQFRLCVLVYHCVHSTAQHRCTCLTQPVADIRDRHSSLSPLCWRHNTAGAVDSSGYLWQPRLSGGCSMCMEQSATRDSGLLLTCDILQGDQVSRFSSVIRLTWRCIFRLWASVCVELYNSLANKLCKVPLQLCDGAIFLVVVVAQHVVLSPTEGSNVFNCVMVLLPQRWSRFRGRRLLMSTVTHIGRLIRPKLLG